MMNMFRGRSASSATAEDKRRLQAKVGALFKHLILKAFPRIENDKMEME